MVLSVHIDLWDPSGSNNNASVFGEVAVFGEVIAGGGGGTGFVPGVVDDNQGMDA